MLKHAWAWRTLPTSLSKTSKVGFWNCPLFPTCFLIHVPVSTHGCACSWRTLPSPPLQMWRILEANFGKKKKSINFSLHKVTKCRMETRSLCLHFVCAFFPLGQTPAGLFIGMLVTGVCLPDLLSPVWSQVLSCCSPSQKAGCKSPPRNLFPRIELIRKCAKACKQGPSPPVLPRQLWIIYCFFYWDLVTCST